MYLEDKRAQAEQVRTHSAAVERVTKAEARSVMIGSVASASLAVGGLVAGVLLVATGNMLAGLVITGTTGLIAGIARVVSAARGGQPDEH